MNEFAPCLRLLSLWDIMEQFHPQMFATIAHQLAKMEQLIENPPEEWNRLLSRDSKQNVTGTVNNFLKLCKDVCDQAKLVHSTEIISHALHNETHSQQEMRLLVASINSELRRGLFLQIPGHRAKFWEYYDIVSDAVKAAFPSASSEVTDASTAYSLAMNTASVFHAMRAAEIGLRALADELSVTFPHGNIELEQWHTILSQIESKINDLNKLPKSTQKSEDQKFYSQAAMQFRYFKDGARVRVAHARESFSESQALALLNHTCDFFEVLASRLKEKA